MRKSNRLAVIIAAGFVVATSLSSSAFADWRNRDETSRGDRSIAENRDRSLRDDERHTVEGRISNITRERGHVRGVVQDINYRRGLLYVRDDYSRRILAVDMDRVGRRSLTIGDLRRGDYIDIVGEWSRRGIFEAYRVDDRRGYRRW